MVSAAQEFVKSGFGEEQAAELAQVSEMFRNVVDEEISSAESAGFLVSMMKAYGNETTEFAEHVANAVDNVSNNMAVSSADIQSGLSKVASAFSTTGNTAEQSIALITSATEVMHGQANKVARGWRTASATLSKMAESSGELSYSVNGVQKSISLLDETTGDFIGTYATMNKIYEEGWQQMSNLEKANLALQIGSKTQMEVVLSTLNNFDGAIDALNYALDDNNAAWVENERYMESIEAQLNLVKSQFSNFILGDGGLQKGTVNLLKFANGLLNVINSLGGLKTIIVALMGLAITSHIKEILNVFEIISVGVQLFKGTLGGLAEAYDYAASKGIAFSTALEEMGMVSSVTQLAIGGLFAAITVGVAAFSLINSHIEKHNQKIKELRDNAISSGEAIRNEISAIDESQARVENDNLTRSQLNDILEKNITNYDKETDALNNVADARQTVLDKLDEEKRKRADAWLTENEAQAKTDKQTLEEFDKSDVGVSWNTSITPIESEIFKSVKSDKEALELYDEEIKRLTDGWDNLSKVGKENVVTMSEHRQTLYDNIEAQEKNVATMLYMQSVLDGTDESLNEYNEFCKESVTQQNNIVDSTKDVENVLANIKKEYGYGKDELIAYIKANDDIDFPTTAEGWLSIAAAIREERDSTDYAKEALSDLGDSLSSLESDYNSLSEAIADYNDGNGISAANLDKLLELTRQHANAISFDNGQIKISEQYFQEQADAAINSAEATLIHETQSRLAAIADNDLTTALDGLGTAADNTDPRLQYVDSTIIQVGEDASLSASQIRDMWAAFEGSDTTGYSKAQKDAVKEVENYFKSSMSAMESYRKQIHTSYSSTAKASAKSSGSAAKESKDAWLEAYKAEKETVDSMYETGILNAEQYAAKLQELSNKYLTDTVDHQKAYASEIKKIYEDTYKALKAALKESLEDEEDRLKKIVDDLKDEKSEAVKALKRQNEETLKGIKAQIDALKKEQEAIKDGYNERIDALKKETKEYERQTKLMQLKEKLAKAKATYKYVMDEQGRFQWLRNQEAVDETQEALYEEEMNQAYEREIEALEDARDAADKLYDQRIEDLEDYYDRVKDEQDKAVEDLEDHYDAMIKLREQDYDNFKSYADKLLNGQLQAVENENSVWATRLNNLVEFVNEYNRVLATLGNAGSSTSASYSGGTPTTRSSSGGTSSGYGGNSSVNAANAALKANEVKRNTTSAVKKATTAATSTISKVTSAFKKHAAGIPRVDEDELAIVGEDPNKEILVGSKINNGVLTHLPKGTGVINADSTRTLAGLINSYGAGKANYTTNNSNSQQTIQIENITLPEVKNGQDFIDYLQNFNVDMTTRAYGYR